MSARPVLRLGDPVVVSRAPLGLTGWGPWQFPSIERLNDGLLHAGFHANQDSAKDYGKSGKHALSSDDGRTWREVPDQPDDSGVLLSNGDRLRAVTPRSRPTADLRLPPPVGSMKGSYGGTFTMYDPAALPEGLRGKWRFLRRKPGSHAAVEETATVRIPGEVQWAAEGVLCFPWMWRMRVAPDGTLWGPYYGPPRPTRGGPADKWQVQILRSLDHGRSWDTVSEIFYQPDPDADPRWDQWDGFTEPNLGFPRDGSLLCFLRTTDGHGIGPLYWCRSRDGGATWGRPRVFDDRGVWPCVLELAGGTMLVSYGRPGLFVRAAADPEAREWCERAAVVEPGAFQTDTCSYSDMVALDDRTALIAYSSFTWPDPEGRPRKTILVRTVEVVMS
jgi:hypothetical protein